MVYDVKYTIRMFLQNDGTINEDRTEVMNTPYKYYSTDSPSEIRSLTNRGFCELDVSNDDVDIVEMLVCDVTLLKNSEIGGLLSDTIRDENRSKNLESLLCE